MGFTWTLVQQMLSILALCTLNYGLSIFRVYINYTCQQMFAQLAPHTLIYGLSISEVHMDYTF